MKWLYTLEKDYTCNLNQYLTCIELEALTREIQQDIDFHDDKNKQRLKITQAGEIVVYQGYSWDGNSPKINVFDLFWLGTPDGIVTKNKPITYYASLIHDVLGQF